MKQIQITMQERWAASRHTIQKSKKTYTRKEKHSSKQGPHKGPFLLSKALL
jgi:hypothetical protein